MGSYSISVGYGKTTIYHVPYFYFCRALTAFVVVLSFSLSSALFFSVDDVPFFFLFLKIFRLFNCLSDIYPFICRFLGRGIGTCRVIFGNFRILAA